MSGSIEATRLAAFGMALARLRAALDQPKTEWTRDAAIQRFEFSFELGWKTAMHFARREGVDCASPREALRAAARLGWLPDDPVWLEMLDDRNRTTHTYNEAIAEQIYARLSTHHQSLAALLTRLTETSGAG